MYYITIVFLGHRRAWCIIPIGIADQCIYTSFICVLARYHQAVDLNNFESNSDKCSIIRLTHSMFHRSSQLLSPPCCQVSIIRSLLLSETDVVVCILLYGKYGVFHGFVQAGSLIQRSCLYDVNKVMDQIGTDLV